MRTRLAIGALAMAGLFAAGCSSGSTPSHPAGASHGNADANAAPDAKRVYISCLISHGVHIPPPPAGGNGAGTPAAHSGSGVNRNSPQFRRAEQACRSLQPVGAQPVTTQDQIYYLRAAQCMRAHGVPQFPDPVFANGGVSFPVPSGIDTHSRQVQGAIATCRRLIPQGLPYSR